MPEPISSIVEANGTRLYCERRGTGPSLLMIPGAEGDAEEYLRVAELLEGEFTVITYDRRAYSRSPRPEGYDGTTVEQQADDAAALLAATGLGPALVWGNSSGAIISLGLILRHPEAATRAMLHEPPLFTGAKDPEGVLAWLKQATANGKVPFLRMLTGDELYDSFSQGYRDRLDADRTFIPNEFNVFEYFRPSDEDLAAIEVPTRVLCGVDSPPFFMEAATWLAGRMGTTVRAMPGHHGVHYSQPEEVARAIREFAKED